MELDDAIKILAAFQREGVQYVLVGSMGMAVHGVIRATRDIDVFVSPDPENVARLRGALEQVFADPSISEITADDLGGDYPAVQYVPPVGDFWIDILARWENGSATRTSSGRPSSSTRSSFVSRRRACSIA